MVASLAGPRQGRQNADGENEEMGKPMDPEYIDRDSRRGTYFDVIFALIVILTSGFSAFTTYLGFAKDLPLYMSIPIAVIIGLGLLGVNFKIRSARINDNPLAGPFAVFVMVFVFSFISNTNAFYSRLIERDIVRETQDEAWLVFDEESTKALKVIDDHPTYQDELRRIAEVENEITKLRAQITDRRNPGLGERAQEHLRRIEELLDTDSTDLVPPSSEAPMRDQEHYAAELVGHIRELIEERKTRGVKYGFSTLHEEIQGKRKVHQERVDAKDYRRNHTDEMSRDLNWIENQINWRLSPNPELELEDINDKADEVGKFKYTWRNFVEIVSPVAIVLIRCIGSLARHPRPSNVPRAVPPPRRLGIPRMAAQDGAKPVAIQPIGIDEDDQLNTFRTAPPLPDGVHCLFTVGAVGAGKSTLQHALIHRLYTDEGIDLTFRNEEGEVYQDPDLQEWIYRFDQGEFPERTREGTLQSFSIEFWQHRRRAKLSFVEISGEHFQAILPRSGQPDYVPQLAPDLEHILTTKAVKKLFLFVADTTRHDPAKTSKESRDDRDQRFYEDMLFSCFLRRIRDLGLNRIKLLFAATKWDAAPNRNLDPERFFRAHFPQTRAALRGFPTAQVQYIRFTIGIVQTGDGEPGHDSQVPQIVQRDSTPIERVIQWLHTHTTGRTLRGYPATRPTFWEKIKGWFAT